MADTFTKAKRSRIMAAIKGEDTTPELAVRRLLRAMGHKFSLHVRSLPGTPDVVFRKQRKAINVSGCFWHMHRCGRCRIPASRRAYWVAKLEGNRARDLRVRRQLNRAGWRLLTVWECQIHAKKAASLQTRLAAFLGKSTKQRLPRKTR